MKSAKELRRADGAELTTRLAEWDTTFREIALALEQRLEDRDAVVKNIRERRTKCVEENIAEWEKYLSELPVATI